MLARRLRRLPLSTKLLLVFGSATTLLILVALTIPWVRMGGLVEQGQLETARELVAAWLSTRDDDPLAPESTSIGDALIAAADPRTIRENAETSPDLAEALEHFESHPERRERFRGRWDGLARRYAYALAARDDSGEITRVTVLQRRSEQAAVLLAVNSLFLLAAGSIILAVALVFFAGLTSRLVIRPLRALREWAQDVRDGDASARAQVETGDEFEQLAETFNLLLDELADRQRQLRAINSAMDIKLNELAEANESLDRAGRLKSEFLATISHELRTPLNSIIGFTDMLIQDTPPDGQPASAAGAARTRRYLENVLTSAKGLLDQIQGLLEITKLEAGRLDLALAEVDLPDACRGLVALLSPMADRCLVTLHVHVAPDVPRVETDPRKLQHILSNLLSNAIKFTDPRVGPEDRSRDAREPSVDVRVEPLPGASLAGPGEPAVRVSVIDNGPGIEPEDQERIFQRFEQLDAGHERVHGGAGLGLAISRELAAVIQAELQLVSEPGRGSMFSVLLPKQLDRERLEETRLETRFRGSLTRARPWT